ncbi:putative pectinesterase/pectinesterase inhibitor 21 [Hibiscus syriacus]|uniref:Pectinesterase n=1 Tax=Hibiscus syriacus TaxID=106335 RepID=A0A6A3BC47_HIBSY|nr:probable pectinesterase/pectinesterase inhibitor 21 [Hibiscus syriacus]KAE8712369.1 putative pectinesterase/pectinesterase inhibitor 21 [Hibiscus syriacus]
MGKAPAIIGVCSVILVAMVVAVAVGVNRRNGGKEGGSVEEPATSSKAVKSLCQPIDYKKECEESLKDTNSTDPKELIRAGFKAAIHEIQRVVNNSGTVQQAAKDPMTRQAVDNCKELMGYAIDDLHNSFDELGAFDVSRLDEYIENLKIWMGGAMTYQQTCLDGFINVSTDAGEKMKRLLNTSQKLTINGLAMVSDISKIVGNLNIQGLGKGDKAGAKRKLMAKEGFPVWVSFRQRMLLLQNPSEIKPNVIVAKDGSGKYITINEALKEVPKKSPAPFVIYIKTGVYSEQVIVDKHMHNVMFVGDGPTKTVITGNLNFADGTITFRTATVGVAGPKFMAKDIGFENSAGAIKHQAVAVRVQGDQSIFYNCQFDGYQDTLYAHSHRQYYRDCTISGTIDFIFGNSASVYQNCKLIVRKPLDNQQCIITAQGREDNREASGFVLQNCTITGDPDYLPVKARSKTHLGRPWRLCSRTIIMQSQMDDIVTPEGWMPWNGDFALDTLFYAEYNNRGPGAEQTRRVKWKGIQQINEAQAQEFTAGVFLRGEEWIQNAGVPYTAGMIPGL